MSARRRLIVHGRVHGVGFRLSVARVADSRGVAGWVRNLADGTVEVVAEGGEDDVAAVERFARRGPRAADVSRVDATSEPVEGLVRFDIR